MYIELLALTLKALEIDFLEKDEKYKIREIQKNNKVYNSKLLTFALRSKKNEIRQKIRSYKKFITHKNKLFLTFNVSEEYYSFKQYLNKFDYYLAKYTKRKEKPETNYLLAIKGLLLLEYFIENFKLNV